MDVLLLAAGKDDPVGLEVAARLRAAGHGVRRCHEPSADAFPCVALAADGRCPLDDADTAVAVHVPGPSADTEREVGVRCALRLRMPVVSVGSPGRFAAFVDEVVEADGVVEACGRAVVGASPRHAAAIHSGLSARGLDARVRVQRSGRDLHVTLSGDVEPGDAVHALSALRRYDPYVGNVGVAVEP